MQEIRHFLIGNFLHFTAGVNIYSRAGFKIEVQHRLS